MAGKILWVKNNGNDTVRFKANKMVKGSDTPVVVQIEFSREKTNRITQSIEESGYTQVAKEDYDALMVGSKIFKSFVEKGTLVSFNEAPDDAFVGEQRVANLQAKIAELEAALNAASGDNEKIAALEAANEAAVGELDAATSRIAELDSVVSSTATEIGDLKKEIVDLGTQLKEANAIKDALEEEFETYKKQFPVKTE